MAPYSIAWRTVANRSRGFTLIEVMIVVVVLAILMAVAYPSYQDHVRKGRRADAQTFMIQLANRQSQFLLDARAHTAIFFGAGPPAGLYGTDATTAPTCVATTEEPDPTRQTKCWHCAADATRCTNAYYDITMTVASPPPTFAITATPTGTQAVDTYGVMSLNSQGAKTRNAGAQQGW